MCVLSRRRLSRVALQSFPMASQLMGTAVELRDQCTRCTHKTPGILEYNRCRGLAGRGCCSGAKSIAPCHHRAVSLNCYTTIVQHRKAKHQQTTRNRTLRASAWEAAARMIAECRRTAPVIDRSDGDPGRHDHVRWHENPRGSYRTRGSHKRKLVYFSCH